jgi:hypothetical protein
VTSVMNHLSGVDRLANRFSILPVDPASEQPME